VLEIEVQASRVDVDRPEDGHLVVDRDRLRVQHPVLKEVDFNSRVEKLLEETPSAPGDDAQSRGTMMRTRTFVLAALRSAETIVSVGTK
jgi:hypothetical protein